MNTKLKENDYFIDALTLGFQYFKKLVKFFSEFKNN